MGCLAVALSGAWAWGAEFVLQPVGASGSNTIVGTEIRLTSGGQRVFLELKLKAFAPSVVKTYQATLNSAGYSSGAVGTITPALQSCPSANAAGNTACQTAFGDAGTGGSKCLDVDPGPGTVLQCEQAWINRTRTDWIFLGHDVAAAATDLSTLNYRWGAALFAPDATIDDGSTFYGGGLAVDVPANAVGTFTIGFTPGTSISFMADENNFEINPLFLTPAKITVLCTNAAQCNDNNGCTADSCNAQGTCVNTPNYNTQTQCCNPANGALATISDGNACTVDACNTSNGTVTHSNAPSGTACGNPANSQCDLADTCNASGQCQSNILPAGSPCGSTTHTDCDFADTCNGTGACQSNVQPAGTPCGNPSGGPCDNADTCNGSGACLVNTLPNNTPCNDALFCTDNTKCTSGVCGGGTPQNCADSLTCTTDTCNEATDKCDHALDPSRCLIDGVCFADNDLRPGNTCEECDPSTNTTIWTVLADATLCNDGNACTGTGRPGIGFDTCTSGVCAGAVDPECNDQCAFAVPAIVGLNLSDNSGAGIDDGEASCQPDSNHDVWFTYTADCNGAVFISTTGSNLLPINDTVLSVYNACPSSGGIEIACDDDSGVGLNSALVFGTLQGVTYYIRVAGYQGNKGPIVLNLTPADDCLIDGVCYLAGDLNPENDCQSCVPQISTTTWSPRPEGTACGGNGDTECDSPDACDGAGVCEVNHKTDGTPCADDGNVCTRNLCNTGLCTHPPEPIGLACGNPTDTECDNPDTCDGGGTCVLNFEGPGFACGNPSSSQCDRPDSCNGFGMCLNRFVLRGTPCNDGDICTGSDQCNAGVCVGVAIPEAPLVETISSRHLRVTPQPAGSVAPVALRVTSPTWPCLLQWIDANGNLVGIADRVFKTPSQWGTVLVQDPDVVPSSIYDVVAECGTFESTAGSDQTYLWGDINNDGFVDFADISLEVNAFKGIFILPFQAYDVFPCTPDGGIDFRDISDIVNAFKGVPFPCSLPCHN
mgnify:FL=1